LPLINALYTKIELKVTV